MALSNAALAELAGHFGIATDFWDWKGRYTEIGDQAVIAILAALGVDAATPEQAWAALEQVRLRPWRRELPPCVVIEQGQQRTIEVHVPAGDPALVHVRCEDGSVHQAQQVDNHVPDREVDGSWVGEASFALPTNLPLGYHELVLRSNDREYSSSLVVTPSFVGLPRAMGERRAWGYATQLYSVRSAGSWGVGDLVDLADLAVWSATQQHADYILINPLHAAQPIAPMEPSPYLPSSRRYLNPMYLRPEAIAEYALLRDSGRAQIAAMRAELDALLDPAVIDRSLSWKHKLAALEVIFAVEMSPARQMAFEGFRRREGRALRDFAAWCVLCELQGIDWRQWPTELQRPSSPEVAVVVREHADRIRFFEWLQWNAATQLSAAQRAAKDAGMSVGVLTDLAVGVNRSGADPWTMADVFAQGVGVGAPPDQFNQNGQDWGQPPWRPDRLADLGYAPFREMVSSMVRQSGGLRIDHIIGLFRLWWVPEGMSPAQGAYVRYDHEAMIGILALEAFRAGALVIGEDLGTVEPWVRDYLSRRGLLGTSVLWFEQDQAGLPLPADQWREYCMASVTTHDLPPSTGYLADDHVRLRDRLGLLTESLADELRHSERERSSWLTYLDQLGLIDPVDPNDPQGPDQIEQIVLGLYRFICASPSKVLNVALTDAVGDRLTQNQPGTIDEYPNWRIPLSGPDGQPIGLEQVYASPRPMRMAAVMNGWSHAPEPWGPVSTPQSYPEPDADQVSTVPLQARRMA